VISALAIAARSRARFNKTPALCIDHHRHAKRALTAPYSGSETLNSFSLFLKSAKSLNLACLLKSQ
jgi:hypothetical protein